MTACRRPVAVGFAFAVLGGVVAGCHDRQPEPLAETAAAPWFEEVARRSGLNFVHDSGHQLLDGVAETLDLVQWKVDAVQPRILFDIPQDIL